MTSCSIGSLVRQLADLASISVLLYSFGSMVMLFGPVLYGFWSPSMPWRHSYGLTRGLSWQEPFSYEAKVYASLSPDFPVNASSSFFETAQLLWNIQPQSVENRYPLLRHKAVVNVPSLLWSGSDLNQRLYAYMFIQEAGQFGPHPNLSDPRLVSSRIPIAQWEGVCPSNSSDIIISAMCIEEHIPELQYVPGVSWAIVLENHAYPWSNVPKHVQHTLTPLLAGFYNPPLLRNDFTRSRPKLRPLATLKDKGLAADVYPLTIDVELELAGVRQGWVLAQAHLEEHICPTMKTVRIKKLVPAPWDPTKNATRVFTQLVYDDGLIPLDAVRRLSVPLLLVFILSRALIVASLPIMVLTLHHDLMSASRWTGVSRATIATMYVGAVVSSVQLTESFGVRKLWALFWQFVMVYIGVNMDDMTFAPLAGLSWMVYNLFWRKSSPITTSQSSAQEQTPVVTDKAIPDSAAPEVMPNSHSNLVDPVVAIRRSVDRVAMYWIHLLAILAIATAVVYHMLIRQEYSLSSLGVPNELFIGCMRIVQSVVWLPQIIVNHKAKSGSLVPVAFVIPTLVYSVASAIFYHLSGYNMFGEITAYSFPVYLSYVILLLQWIMYRKVKQD